MKSFTIPILEFVLAQPAHKLPVIFTPGKNPLPDCSESPEEVFLEVLRLEHEGLIEAHIIRDVTGKPNQAQIRYITLDGSRYLTTREANSQENAAFSKVLLWGIVGIIVLLVVIFGVSREHLASAGSPHPHELAGTEAPALTPPPAPSPDQVATPVSAPSPSATPTPTPTPIPSPSPTPSPKSKEFKEGVSKTHSRG